ncbi:MAG: glycosyltransferase [Chloroflexota bacterium]
MDNRSPLVSIGLPVYNGENFLRASLGSILNQTFTDFELVISDNASTDSTEEIVREAAAQDSRIRYFRNDVNGGAAWNYNRVFELSRGKYFKWAAHDDIMHCGYLMSCVAVLEADSDIVLCNSLTGQIDACGKILTHEYVSVGDVLDPAISTAERFGELVCERGGWTRIFGVIRSDVLKSTPLIAKYIGSDLALLGELGLKGKVIDLEEFLFWRREHEQTSTRGKYTPRRKRLTWFDTNQEVLTTVPEWRLNWELVKTILRQNLDGTTKIRCIGHVMRRMWQRWRQLLEDIYFALRDIGAYLYSSANPNFRTKLRPLIRYFFYLETQAHTLLKSTRLGLIKIFR